MIAHDVRSVAWWYWLATVLLLTAAMTVWPDGYFAALGLTVVQLVHFAVRERSLTAFPVQVRIGYLALLAIASPAELRLIAWLPIVGTWIQVLFGYCTMARTLSLLPVNRREPLTFALVRRTFLSPPVRGSILEARRSEAVTA
jgi:hypothetical protein